MNSLQRIKGNFTLIFIDFSKFSIELFSIDSIINIPAELITISIEENFSFIELINSLMLSSILKSLSKDSILIFLFIFLSSSFNFFNFLVLVEVKNRLHE